MKVAAECPTQAAFPCVGLLTFLSTSHYPLFFKSRSRRSNAFLYELWSLHLPNSPICRVRRMSAAHAFGASITASSTRMGNSTGFLLLSSGSKAVERRFSAALRRLFSFCHHEGASAPEGSAFDFN